MNKKQPFSKDLLKQLLRVGSSTLYRELKKIEPRLILRFPNYDKSRKIIPDDVFYWLLQQMGVDKETACQRIIEIYHHKEKDNFDSLKKWYGLDHENMFYSNRSEPK